MKPKHLSVLPHPRQREWRRPSDGSTLRLGKPQRMPLPMLCYFAATHNEIPLARSATRHRNRRRFALLAIAVGAYAAMRVFGAVGG